MKYSSFFFAGLTAMVICSTAGAHANALVSLDVNDVSFLFPIKNRKPHPNINLADDLRIPRKIFDQVLLFENPSRTLEDLPYLDGRFLRSAKNWYVTSLRLDPCGEVFALKLDVARRAPGCQARLRLVVQPFNLFGLPVATALHLIYKVDPTEVRLLAESLIEIKRIARDSLAVDTTGLPLMLHPALVAEVGSPEANRVGQALRAMLLDLLNSTSPRQEDRLEIVTMTVQVIIDQWRFVGGYVRNGSWSRFVTEFSKQFNDGSDQTLGLGVEELTCNGNSICLYRPAYQPPRLSVDGVVLTQIFRDLPEMKALQVPGHRSEKIHIESEIIDNPGKTHFFNTNCVSCHASSNLRDPNRLHTDLGIPTGITPFVPKRHLTGLTNNVINFGYWGSVPRISTRTASDSAVVADALNRELGLQNPAPKIGNLEGFWNCLVSRPDFKECLDQ